MDGELICNFKKCRNRLGRYAWVTSCSHIFCDEDGAKEFNKSFSCPACQTNLSSKFEILRIDLQPAEQSKSMLLAGHRPDTILEICSRAMAFWTYQTQQEVMYQSYIATKARERNTQIEQEYNQVLNRSQTELTSLKNQLTAIKKELDEVKKRYSEVSEKLMDRSRQYQKLQTLYDGLRRRTINPAQMDGEGDNPAHYTPRSRPSAASFNMGLSVPVDEVFQRMQSGVEPDRQRRPSSREQSFVFQPYSSTPTISGSSSTGSCDAASVNQQRFRQPMGTPNSGRRPRT